MEGFRHVSSGYVYLALLIMVLMQIIRSVRWGILLSPLEKIDALTLFSVTSVGFLAIVSFPARLGELARPYLITKKSGVKMSAALGTIFIERVLDSITVFAVFILAFFLTPLPTWLIKSSAFFIVLTLSIMVFMVFLLFRREAAIRLLEPVLRRLPRRLHQGLDSIIHSFIDGFSIMADPKPLLKACILSIAFWLVDAAAIYLMFLAFGFQLPLIAPLVLLVILMIGIAIPAGPGFVGNWHYFCILGLSLYDIPKTEALSFAILYHFLSVGIVLALGLVFLPHNRFSLTDLKTAGKGS